MLHSFLYWRGLPDLIVLALVSTCQAWTVLRISREWGVRPRKLILVGAAISIAILTAAFFLRFARFAHLFPPTTVSWFRGWAIAWAFLSPLLVAAFWISRRLGVEAQHHPARRVFLRTIQAGLFGAPAVALGYGAFIERFDLRLREENLVIPDLPRDLDGLRIVQLTDIHLSPFLSERELKRAVAMANETRAHVALVTGDLISSANDPLDACIEHLSRLRADAGIFGCLGNHEIYADVEDYTTERGAHKGIRFLRMEAAPLRFGSAVLSLGGVDYQRFGRPYLPGAEALIQPNAFNVLLSHNPDVFPVAARQGFGLTLSGHTHGGQVRVEILHQTLNIARVFTPYVDGVYKKGNSTIFVSRGIGTIGMPVRLGAPPEVALIRLCRT